MASSGPRRLIAVVGRDQLSIRPSTPPASLTRLKAVSMPSFIWRPSSLAGPENGAAIPNRISRSVMPRTARGGPPARIGAVGVAAAAADGCATTAASDGADEAGAGPGDRPFEIGKLAVRRACNPVRPARHGVATVGDTAVEQLRQVVTLGLVGRGLPDHRRELVDDHLDAGPRDVRAGQRRTDDRSDAARQIAHDIVLSPGAALAAPASRAPSKSAIQRGVIANSAPRSYWTLEIRHLRVSPRWIGRVHYCVASVASASAAIA